MLFPFSPGAFENDAARLERKPEAETVHPPKDFAEWERERLHNRGLSGQRLSRENGQAMD